MILVLCLTIICCSNLKFSRKHPGDKINRNLSPEKQNYYDNLVRKGLYLEGKTNGEKPKEFKINNTSRIIKLFQKKLEKLRKLADHTTLENIDFFGLKQENDETKIIKATQFIAGNIEKYRTKFILYPYKFDYLKNSQSKSEEEGGFFVLKNNLINNQDFEKILSITSVDIKRAKAIYDIDIAILSIPYTIDGLESDLFSDASNYCSYFISFFKKTNTCINNQEDYKTFKEYYPTKGAVVRIDNNDIKNNILYDQDRNELNINLLIIPDYLIGNEETIESFITQEHIDLIKLYQEKGGHIIVSGKSAYLLKKWGIISGVEFDTSKYLKSQNSTSITPIRGCKEINSKNYGDNSYFEDMICFNSLENDYLVSTYPMKITDSNLFTPLTYYTNKNNDLGYIAKETSLISSISDNNLEFIHMAINKKNQGQGRILIINSNSISKTSYTNSIRNMILYSMSRNYVFDLDISLLINGEERNDLPIPAGEEGVIIKSHLKFMNVFEKNIKNIEIDILTPTNTSLIITSTSDTDSNGCKIVQNDKYESLSVSFNKTKYLNCKFNDMEKFSQINYDFNIEILSSNVLHGGTDVPLMYPILYFFDEENGSQTTFKPGSICVQTALAAVLRGTLNIDPSAVYPLPGRGAFFDNVLNVENKENTIASEVSYVAVIPLISPVVDGSDEQEVSKVVPLHEVYYKTHEYEYPWLDVYNKKVDYIDYEEVAGIHIVYVADWDTPVRKSKISRKDCENLIKDIYDPTKEQKSKLESDQDRLNAGNSQVLLKEIYFGDADKFYERAAQRISLFIDTSYPEGAKALYGSNIPNDKVDPYNNTQTKVEFSFSRVDIFFYSSSQYQNPENLTSTHLFSIDQYDQASAPTTNKNLGFMKSVIVKKGHYNSTKELYNTLVPNEYSNVMRQYLQYTVFDPTKSEDLAKITKLNKNIKFGHYMVPVKHNWVNRAGNCMGFEEDVDSQGNKLKSGYLKEYPSLKFIYAHAIDIEILPELSRMGGKLEITMPSNFNFKDDKEPIENDFITTKADNVAFFKTEYNKEKKLITLYFRRGLMPNEAYGKPSKCAVYIEGLANEDSGSFKIKLYQMKYDFSLPELEKYIEMWDKDFNSNYIPFFSLPALYIDSKLKRKPSFRTEYSSEILEYELLDPYTRYGTYFQELLRHRTVWGSAEAHHVTDPGQQVLNSGMALISNIGTSFIPFSDYVTHGSGLLIPGAISTSRLEWKDIWGRLWIQNLRSLYPDIPPVPSPLMNFMMSTTFEILKDDESEERLLEWPSDENAIIRVQMKFVNNYQKFFQPVMCKDNTIPYQKESANDERDPIFINSDTREYTNLDSEHMISLGIDSVYGYCYKNTNAYLSGQRITNQIFDEMEKMMQCAQTNNATQMSECSKKSDELGLPLLKRKNPKREEGDNSKWNYSPLIESYYPEGYINTIKMWDLTETDYYDDAFMKGYPFHLDNNLPALDAGPSWNPAYYKPHNMVAFPIFEGLGYSITYDRNNKLRKKYTQYSGWWSDQLQNKDNTLLAGQQKSNEISVDKEELLKDEDWIGVKGLNSIKNTAKTNLISNRLKNIYVCKYNQHRIKIKPKQDIYAYPTNVFQNNVVPVEPDLDENDYRYTNFNCDDFYQYSPQNISLVDNRVYTGTSRDWLYFALNLRGEAKENINVIMKLKPLEGVKYEGITKVQDGGKFVYWNPANGPNSFLEVNNNINTVISFRVDLTIKQAQYPTILHTFNSFAYLLFTISDEKEKDREYTMSTYMNSYGFGDSTITIFVGGTEATTCKVQPGEYTYIKISFYNNAGFDWNLKNGAIEFEDRGSMFTSSHTIMKNSISNIQAPLKYNFIEPVIPEEIKPYITLKCSDHNIDVAPQFFDFTNINVVTIRDAFEGNYFYKLSVNDNFPDEYRGKMWEIKLNLVQEYFDRLPGFNDPTNIHDYTLKIPPIKFGVPIKSNDNNNGKIFMTLGFSKDIKFDFLLYKYFEIKGIKMISENDITKLDLAVSDESNAMDKLNEVYDSLSGDDLLGKTITLKTREDPGNYYNNHTIYLNKQIPIFPIENKNAPPTTSLYVLVKTYSPQVDSGYKNLLTNSEIFYNDHRKDKYEIVAFPQYITSYSTGPWISVNTEYYPIKYFYNNETFIYIPKDKIYDNSNQLYVVRLKFKNTGTGTSYHNEIYAYLPYNAEIVEEKLKGIETSVIEHYKKDEQTVVKINYLNPLPQNLEIAFNFIIKQCINCNGSDERRQLRNLGNTVKIIDHVEVDICLQDENCQGTNSAHEIIDVNDVISYMSSSTNLGFLTAVITNIGTDHLPKYEIKVSSNVNSAINVENIYYTYYRKIEGIDSEYKFLKSIQSNIYVDQPFTEEEIQNNRNRGIIKITYKITGYYEGGNMFNAVRTEANFVPKNENKSDKNKKWLIILIIVLSLLLISIIAFLVYKCSSDKKNKGERVGVLSNVTEIPKGKNGEISEKKTFKPASKNDNVIDLKSSKVITVKHAENKRVIFDKKKHLIDDI